MSTLVLQWITQQPTFNTSRSDYQPSIALDNVGNIYAAYVTDGTVNGGTDSGQSDIVVFKMSGANGNLIWIQQNPSFNTNGTDFEPSIAVDKYGYVYITYYTNGTVPGGTNAGSTDIVVFKLSGIDGSLQWIQQQATFNTTGFDLSPSIAADTLGNVYIVYNTNGTINGGTNRGGYDIVVFKLLGLNGSLQWIQQNPAFNTIVDDYSPSITVDILGNVYVAYVTDGTTTSSEDIVVFKLLGTNGNLQWVQQQTAFNTTSYDIAPSIAADTLGNIYIAYITNGTINGGTNSDSSDDTVVFKLSTTDGHLIWIKQEPSFNTNGVDRSPSIAVDITNNVYVAYYTLGGTIPGGNNKGSADIVVFKLDGINGNFIWAEQQLAFNTDKFDSNPSLAVDKSGNVYVAYDTFGTIDEGTSSGQNDIVVFKLSSIPETICIFPGAQIFTNNGYKMIEDLKAGDILFDDLGKPVKLINNVKCFPNVGGYTTFYPNCLAQGIPSNTLIITDGHPIKLLNSNKEILAQRFTNGHNIIHTRGTIPSTYSLITEDRIFIPINNVPVCTWSESEFYRKIVKSNVQYILL